MEGRRDTTENNEENYVFYYYTSDDRRSHYSDVATKEEIQKSAKFWQETEETTVYVCRLHMPKDIFKLYTAKVRIDIDEFKKLNLLYHALKKEENFSKDYLVIQFKQLIGYIKNPSELAFLLNLAFGYASIEDIPVLVKELVPSQSRRVEFLLALFKSFDQKNDLVSKKYLDTLRTLAYTYFIKPHFLEAAAQSGSTKTFTNPTLDLLNWAIRLNQSVEEIQNLHATHKINHLLQDEKHLTSLYYAVIYKHIEALHFLLNCENKPEANEIAILLEKTISWNQYKIFSCLLESAIKDIHWTLETAQPLQKIFRELIDIAIYKAQSNDPSEKSHTFTLFFLIEMLLKIPYVDVNLTMKAIYGYNTSIFDKITSSPIHSPLLQLLYPHLNEFYISKLHPTYKEHLQKSQSPEKINLHAAVLQGSLEDIKDACTYTQVDVNAKNEEGLSVLQLASKQKNNTTILLFLLSLPGIHIEENLPIDEHGTTLFDLVLCKQQWKLAALLLPYVDVNDYMKITPYIAFTATSAQRIQEWKQFFTAFFSTEIENKICASSSQTALCAFIIAKIRMHTFEGAEIKLPNTQHLVSLPAINIYKLAQTIIHSNVQSTNSLSEIKSILTEAAHPGLFHFFGKSEDTKTIDFYKELLLLIGRYEITNTPANESLSSTQKNKNIFKSWSTTV